MQVPSTRSRHLSDDFLRVGRQSTPQAHNTFHKIGENSEIKQVDFIQIYNSLKWALSGNDVKCTVLWKILEKLANIVGFYSVYSISGKRIHLSGQPPEGIVNWLVLPAIAFLFWLSLPWSNHKVLLGISRRHAKRPKQYCKIKNLKCIIFDIPNSYFE